MSNDHEHPSESRPQGKPLRKSKTLMLAFLATAIGLAMWVYSMATRPASDAAPAAAGANSLVTGFAPGESTPPAPTAERRLVDDASPALFRFGGSFIGGFFLAMLLKKFIKLTALALVAIGGLIFLLKHTGVINLDWGSVESQVQQGGEWAKAHASQFKTIALGYLPSGASAIAGMFVGARHG